MSRLYHIVLLGTLALSLSLGGCTASESNSELDITQLAFAEDNGSITLPDGFRAVVVADSLGYARHLTVDDDGDIYVALRRPNNGYGIVALRDNDGDGKADVREYFGPFSGTGIDLHNGYLYFGTDTSVVRYPMEGVDLVPQTEPETVADGFPVQNQHATKSITFDNSGNLYVNVGAPSNACQEEPRSPESPGMEPCPQLEYQGGIWQFDADATGQTQQEDGHRFATGIRNAVALDWNQKSNQLYALQHGRDQLGQLWSDYYTLQESAEQPAEEFIKVDDGDDFGWPYVYYDWKKESKMMAPEYGGDGTQTAPVDNYESPIMAFPGHWAPNDLIFYRGAHFPSRYKDGAFIAFHGSWNRSPVQQGYKVVYVPFQAGDPAGDHEVFANGFAGTDSLQTSRDAEYRPMGLDEGPDGTLYITDSVQGRLWRVVYTGN